jgi:NitT/TauT family transport system ATP-binding protein
MNTDSTDTAFSFRNVVKEYVSREGKKVRALDDVSFDAPAGGITCVVGPTGSGKSTLLRVVSGLEQPDVGAARVNGATPEEMTGRIGYLTQRHTLFPWMRVRDNIGLPLDLRETPSRERDRRIGEITALLGLEGTEDLYPYEISGGMQQRAALGRLLASTADHWLMDEPFTALDERTRHQLQQLLVRLVRENRFSALFVTHSIDEAVFLADQVVILSAGPGRVVEVFDVGLSHPRDRFSPDYSALLERIRLKIESVLK